MTAIKDWVLADGDNTLRLHYNLNDDSVVYDVGAYEGWFADKIDSLYGSKIYCFEPVPDYSSVLIDRFNDRHNISISQWAISNFRGPSKMKVTGDTSSLIAGSSDTILIQCSTLYDAMCYFETPYIDLLKLNIEGAEYDVLENVIGDSIIKSLGNIQVQFHNIGESSVDRYNYIEKELVKTHRLTYKYPFIWENWEKKI